MSSQITTSVGYTADGQKVVLLSQEAHSGLVHSVRVEPRTFRDQPQEIIGLTTENLVALAQAARRLG